MKSKFKYRLSEYCAEDIAVNEMSACNMSPSLCIGLRLEDLCTAEDAKRSGFRQLDELSFVKECNVWAGFCINDLCKLFISSYVFMGDVKDSINTIYIENHAGKYVRNRVAGPLNLMKRRKEYVEIHATDEFYHGVNRILMLDSMSSLVLVLDKLA